MPRGFLRSTSAEVGGRIIVVRIAVQRLVPASDPRSYAVSVHFTWNELGEARTTLVICTDTVRSPTLANGEVERAYSPRNCAPRLVAKSYASSQSRRISTGSSDTERTFVMTRDRCQATCGAVARYSATADSTDVRTTGVEG